MFMSSLVLIKKHDAKRHYTGGASEADTVGAD